MKKIILTALCISIFMITLLLSPSIKPNTNFAGDEDMPPYGGDSVNYFAGDEDMPPYGGDGPSYI